jgi:hypothetical protein
MTDEIAMLLPEAMERATSGAHVPGDWVTDAVRRVHRRRALNLGVTTVLVVALGAGGVVALTRTTGPTQRVGIANVAPSAGSAAAMNDLIAPPLGDSRTPVAPKAHALLLGLAAKAAQQPEPPAGKYDYVKSFSWNLDGEVRKHGSTSWKVDRTHRQSWIAADGSGRLVQSIDGSSNADASGRYGPRGLVGPTTYPSRLSDLRAKLAEQDPGEPATTIGLFDEIEQVWEIQLPTPQLESSLLNLLATEPGISDRGLVTDADGRPGVVVTADADPQHGSYRDALVFDPDTGMPLDDVRTPPGSTANPTTKQYEVFLGWDRTESPGVVPATTQFRRN